MKNDIQKPRLFISSKKGVFSRRYDDIYFDKLNGLKEKEYVYINANDLANRFNLSNKFCIAELGFGTGLNFILTWKLWKKNRRPNSSLTYISFENAPLSKTEMKRVYDKFADLNLYSKELIKKLSHTYKANRSLYFYKENINLILILRQMHGFWMDLPLIKIMKLGMRIILKKFMKKLTQKVL